MTLIELRYLLPELFLGLTLLATILAETSYHGEKVRLAPITALFGLATAWVQIILTATDMPARTFGGTLSYDGISFFFRIFSVTAAMLALVVTLFSEEVERRRRPEFSAFVVAAALSLCVIASACDLIVVGLAIGLFGLVGVFLSGFSKFQSESIEAAVKYFLVSGFAATLVLLSAAILFMHTGSLNLFEIQEWLGQNTLPQPVAVLSAALLFFGVAFLMAAFPGHLWAPDAWQGAPSPAGLYLMLLLPAAAFSFLIRFLRMVLIPELPEAWIQLAPVIAFSAGATMLVGALMAFSQTHAKRMLAFLVISQLGFVQAGLLVLSAEGLSAVLLNCLVGLFSLVGIVGALCFLSDRLRSDELARFRGVLARSVPESLCLLIFLACFLGLPPLPGFLARFTLFAALIRDQWVALAVVAIIAQVLVVACLARFAFTLAGDFRRTREPALDVVPAQRTFLVGLLFPILVITVFAQAILQWAGTGLLSVAW